ncbi:MAG: PspC domain-containing protein [Vicingus serpentipes]|nr:PspC domain-containing protein [Vicingus serpentipes]
MNQTVTANIGGIVFHIEVDAFDSLTNYLNKIKSYFNNSEEREEIMRDIEGRIAEIFSSKLNERNQVIKNADVTELIEVMGKPEQYIDEDEVIREEKFSSDNTYRTAKKFFRDPDDRIIGGVAAGIANYFGIDAVWLRLFFIGALFFGFGFLLYIILWIVIPEAKTASDKLQMKGEPVNIDNIGKTFKEEAQKVSENLKNNGKQYGKKAESIIASFFDVLGVILTSVFKVLGKIIGVAFLIIGTFWLVALIGMLVGSNTIFSITSDGIFSVEAIDFFNLIFVSEDQFYWALTGVLLAIGIPIITLIYGGIKLLLKIKTHYSIGLGMFIIWIIGVSICAMVGIRVATELTNDESYTNTEVINNSINEFYISAAIETSPGKGILEDRFSVISLDKDSIFLNDIRLYIYESKTDSMELKVVKHANGRSRKEAINNAKMITYHYAINDSLIYLNNYLSTLKQNKIRGQEVKLKLYLPVGKTIFLDKSLKHIIHNVANVTDTWDHNMLGEKWVMLEDGLTCLDCDEIEGITSEQLNLLRSTKNQ